MKRHHIRWLAAFMLFLFSQIANAAINCSISSPGFAVFYSGTQSVAQTSFTINCTRLPNDPITQSYNVRPDNGLNFKGQSNQGIFGTNKILYENYQNSTCTTAWRPTGNGGDIIGTISFGTSLTTSVTRDFWGCVPAAQNVAPGVYTDTITMTMSYGNNTANNIFPISINTNANCSISSPPSNIAFTYTAFQNSNATANTPFSVICSNTLPYTMSLNTADGVISGLNYALGINTVSNGGINPLGSSGNGLQQTFYINGSMPANQAGNCSTGACTGSQFHTLTVTY